MNERIKELALQAGVAGHFAAGTEYATLIPLSDEVQKFAELIVWECINILPEKVKIDDIYDANILVKCGTAIKEHFGVEL